VKTKAKVMRNINIQKIIYHVRHRYLTLNNVVILVAFMIAAGWVWASLGAMQRNYSLQKEIDYKKQTLELTQLQRDNLALQQNYYQTPEYQELAVRDALGLVMPGEKALVLPPNSAAAIAEDATKTSTPTVGVTTSNLEQWVNFLFGGYSKSISDGK
jgi:cell division protein FtsB